LVTTFTDKIVENLYSIEPLGYEGKLGAFFGFYSAFFSIIIFLAIYNLAQSFYFASDKDEKSQIKYVLFGISFFAATSFVVSFLVPLIFHTLAFTVIDNFSFSIFLIVIAYTIIKFHLFNIKVIATELLTFGMWILMMFRALTSDNAKDQIINWGGLFVAVLLGIYLIRSVVKEVTQREKIEKLAKDLEEANERLKELDQLKSEFVSLATHQIRGPLAAIKGYSSLMLEGDFGEIPKNLQSPIETVFNSSKSLAVIVDDFLNVSRIEQGKMKYDFTDFDLCELVSEVTNEQKPNLEKKNLTLSTGICQEPILIHGDRGKIKQIVGNIIDNSIKYTIKGGISVTMEQFQSRKKVRLIVKDTGVGIRPETIPHLFQKFSRAEDASKVNILGTGLGLYVAKEMVKAHDGKIWVESDGEGKGSTFFIELNTK
jgi:signal transduction histidine kinase